jgi:hypothetical protein
MQINVGPGSQYTRYFQLTQIKAARVPPAIPDRMVASSTHADILRCEIDLYLRYLREVSTPRSLRFTYPR